MKFLSQCSKKIYMAIILLRNCMECDGHKDNGVKHCHRADRTTTLLEPSLNVLSIKFGWGPPHKSMGWTKNDENENGCLLWQKTDYLCFYTT